MFWLGVLPIILTKSLEIAPSNCKLLRKYSIQLESPKVQLSLLPIINVQAKKLKVEERTNSDLIEIKNFNVSIRLLPLLSGNLHVNKISADNVFTSLNLTKDIELDKDFFEKIRLVNVVCDSVSVVSFTTILSHKDLEMPIKHAGSDLLLQCKNRYIKFKMKSSLSVAGKTSSSNWNLFLPKNNDVKRTVFDLNLSNFNIAPLRLYLKHYLPKDLLDLRGQININANKGAIIVEFEDCAAIMKDSAKSIVFPKKLVLKSKFNMNRKNINLSNLDILSDKIKVTLEGKIYNYFGKSMPTLDLVLRVDSSKVEEIVKLLPPFIVEELDVHKLKKYPFYGDVLANLSIKGRLPEPDVNGKLYINNGILLKPIPKTSSGAIIKLNFTGRHVNFYVNVPAGNSEFVKVEGSQELYNVKFADMLIKSSKAVDLNVAQDVLNPLHEILNFIIGPVPIMDISGNGNIDIVVKGNRKKPHIWGVMNIYNSLVWFNDMPDFKLVGADALITFKDQNVIFTSSKGIVNKEPFELTGSCNLLGKFDFNVVSKGQPTELLLNSLKTSKLLSEWQSLVPPVSKAVGNSDLNLKIYGNVNDINDLRFNKNFFAKGNISFDNNEFYLQGVGVNEASGSIDLNGIDSNLELKGLIASLPMHISARVKNDLADVVLDIPKFNPNFLIEDLIKGKNKYLPYVSVFAKYKGKLADIQYDKIFLEAKVLAPLKENKIKFYSGQIGLNNGNLNISDLKGYVQEDCNPVSMNLKVVNAFETKPVVNGQMKLKTPNLSFLNEIFSEEFLPENISKYTKVFEFKKGSADLNINIINGKMNTQSDLGGISFCYKPLNMPIDIINGMLVVKNNILKLNKINMLVDDMPILVDGSVKDVFEDQSFNIYINSKPHQEFIDKYINKNQVYPIKIKGDIVYWIKAKGVRDNYSLKTKIDLNKDSSIYYFGATVGDIENSISVYQDSRVLNGKLLKLKEFTYDKIIDSLNGKQTKLNLLKAWGDVQILNDDLVFDSFNIKTYYPTDARIFNIIFRKPNIKQGLFTSDLKINGKLSNPKVLGSFHIFETNIPFFDTAVKNIELIFDEKNINMVAKGDVVGNVFEFEGVLKNKLVLPYAIEKGFLYAKNLNLNKIIDKIKMSEVEENSGFESLEEVDLNITTFKNLRLKADSIVLRNIQANNFDALASLNDNSFLNVENFSFNLAQGLLNGNYQYDFSDNDMGLNINITNIDANEITKALFDLDNQIYGAMTGKVELACNGTNFQACMESLNGATSFNVANGRMPKLGSLEYLLKAANLLKGGITSLSINSVIDLITPLKTGEFSDISGFIRIKDGMARNIEISSKGKDLNLFINGTYNFSTSVADMQVYGLLSKNLTTLFGPLGNISINTLFNVIPGVDLSEDGAVLSKINKIPGIEFSSKMFRKFVAEIKGNINGDNYVKSFRWVN